MRLQKHYADACTSFWPKYVDPTILTILLYGCVLVAGLVPVYPPPLPMLGVPVCASVAYDRRVSRAHCSLDFAQVAR